MTSKAIIIKGPSAGCKSYFTGLPDTLEELIQKASQLFPVPPNHTGHLMLEGDDAILMPDVLTYLKDREVLTFHWTANTPRSSLRQPLRKSEEMSRHVNSSGGSSTSSTDSQGRTSRGVRWDRSVLANDAAMSRSTSEGATSSSTPQYASVKPFRYSSAARAEHSRRVLSEQEEQKKSAIAAVTKPADTDADPFRPESTEEQAGGASVQASHPDTSPQTAQHDVEIEQQKTTEEMSSDALVDPLSPSRFDGAQASARVQSDEEQQTSSPLASPTRNIRGAQKSNNEWGTPLGSDKVKVDLIKEPASDNDGKKENERPAPQPTVEFSAVPKDKTSPSTKSFKASSASSSPPGLEQMQVTLVYKRMASVVDALRNHPSNVYFRSEPNDSTMSYLAFVRQSGRQVVDLNTIAGKIAKQAYAKEAPFPAFAADLSQMWANARAYFGMNSPQARCADCLERFSRIVMNELRKESAEARPRTQNGGGKHDSTCKPESKSQAMARAAKLLQAMSQPNRSTAQDGKHRQLLSKPLSRPVPSAAPKAVIKSAEQQQRTKVTPQGVQSQPKTGNDKASIAFAPGTHAFLATLFTKGNTAAQPTSASATTMARLQQQFGPSTHSMPVVSKTTAPMRMSLSPRSQTKTLSSADSSNGHTIGTEPVIRIKRPAEESARKAVAKRAHIERPDKPATDIVMADAAGVSEVQPTPAVLGSQEVEQASAVVAPVVVKSAPATIKADTRTSPRSRTASKASAVATVKEAEVDEKVESPRRSPRRAQPTEKARESGRTTRSRNNSSPVAEESSGCVAKSAAAPVVQAQVPQRMMTRGVAAAITGTPRARRTAAV